MMIGIMTKHILSGDDFSIFDYMPDYSGSGELNSIISLPIIYLWDMSKITSKISAIIFFIGLVILLFKFMDDFFNRELALIVSLLFVLTPNVRMLLFASHFLDGLFFNLLLLYFIFKYYDKMSIKHSVILGIVSGFAYWITIPTLGLVITLFLFWYVFDKKFFMKPYLFIFLIFFVIGYSPGIYGHFTQSEDFNALQYEFDQLSINDILPNLKDLIIYKMPLLLDDDHKILSYIYYILMITSYIAISFFNKNSIKTFLLGLLPFKKYYSKPTQIKREIFLLVYPLIFLFALSLSSRGSALGHLFPIYIFPPILISLFLKKLWKTKRTYAKLLILVLIIIFSSVIDVEGKKFPFEKSKDINKIITVLDGVDIKHVYSHSFISLPLVFQSNENIIVHDPKFEDFMHFNYPKYNRIVENSTKYAFVYYENSSINKILKLYLDAFTILYQKQRIDDKAVYYSLSKKIRPKDFNANYIFIKDSVGDKVFKNQLDYNNISYKRWDFDNNKVIYFLTGIN
jgi:hypothetical protein